MKFTKIFEAEFRLNVIEAATLYDANGRLIETETEINETALPQAVLAACYGSTNRKKNCKFYIKS
jgi:hypothetical protein